MTPIVRVVALAILWASLVSAFTCITPNVRRARKGAEIIFRGRVTAFRQTSEGEVVVFAVDRVWKGKVPRVFEMPALKEGAACIGFWPSLLKIGNYLLVYAYKFGDPPVYITNICSRTNLVEESRDFAQLLRLAKYSDKGAQHAG